ncbi:phage virion morphogenesis protein [Croceicoccus sp. BE223]|uniref:phage virion morphogenesis protein n=1 Tax=Croceicoccus sp. BE223 TaxID=2817716 RepID=UPI002862956C|nr:phage virion morphogenesis protein [Croceicoccus sp. BE223]MDR7101469.1 phage virion morphogenesis protein [Croceicoccus sp. BE223]
MTTTSGDGLEAIEPWLAGVMERLKPGQRIRLARKIGQQLRRNNAERIARNVQPDGSAMEPRKPRDKASARRGKMFRKIGLARNMRIMAKPDSVELRFSPLVAGAAAVHHFGLVDKVEHAAGSPKYRYPARRLLGLPKGDRDMIMETVMEALDD